MPIQIKQDVEPGCSDPVGLLTACHRRIERFLHVLALIAQRGDGNSLCREDAEVFGRALRYFREAAPNHTADEEHDLFPALQRHNADARELLQGLEEDHARASSLHLTVDRIGQQWLQGPVGDADLAELRRALAELEALYGVHIQTEEQKLFPIATRVLGDAELERIGRNMADRRGIAYIRKRAE